MMRIKEIVVVEGKHDIDAVRRVVDATVLDTNGFGIFTDPQLAHALRELAKERGAVILTDSDKAGFAIRTRVAEVIGHEYVRHAYIPDIYGKERRKKKPSKEGKLGVEGMADEALLRAFTDAGVSETATSYEPWLTKARLYEDGLTGQAYSHQRQNRLKKKLNLPERLSLTRMVQVLNIMLTEERYRALIEEIKNEEI